jgi:iron complex outermembrane receptor protein
MTTRLHFFGGPIEDGLVYYGLPKFVNENRVLRRQNLVYWEADSAGTAYSYAIHRRPQEIENFSQPHYELLHQWEISSSITLHNTLFYYTGDGFFNYDASWADTSLLRLGYSYGIPTDQNPVNTIVQAYVGNEQGGWLPRVEMDHGSGELTLGAEIRVHRSVHWGKIDFAEDLPPDYDPEYHFYQYEGQKDIVSIYAHEMLRLARDVTIMADVQIVHNCYGIKNEKYLGHDFSLPYLFVNPRAGVNVNFTQTTNGYLSLAYTSREPRLRNLYAAEDSWFGATPQFQADTSGGVVRYDFNSPLAKPERLLDIEIGGSYRDGSLVLNGNLFWMEFTDELIKSGQVDIFGQPVTGNAERTKHVGVEIDGSVALLEDLTLSGNLTLSRNRLVRYKAIDESGMLITLDGNRVAGFPDALANLRLTGRLEQITGSFSMKFVGPFYTDNYENPSNRNDGYMVFNADLCYEAPRFWNIGLVFRGEVRNLFDKLYFSNGEGNAFFPAAERNFLFGIAAHL